MKVNWNFQWGVWRNRFAPNISSCYDMSPCYFTDVERNLNVFCICYSFIFYSSGLAALSLTPNLDGQVITICLVPIFKPTRSQDSSWHSSKGHGYKNHPSTISWWPLRMVGSQGGVNKYLVAGSARVWILSGTQYEKVEFCCGVGYWTSSGQ